MTPLDRWRMWLGAVLVIGLLAMAVLFGLGQVQEQTSFGLTQILTIVSTIALGWAQWAFPHALRAITPGQTNGNPATTPPPSPTNGTPLDMTQATPAALAVPAQTGTSPKAAAPPPPIAAASKP